MKRKQIFCECCGAEILAEPIWLELDQRTQTFHKGKIPTNKSQGGFPFGYSCAKRKLAEHRAATRKAHATT
jgi:hypothetical protein